jgi:uncharacterized membrane protein YedE/YeeE
MKLLSVLVAGLIFGLGLAISGMMNPAKVIGFLDLAGHWDPTLAFVMGGGLLVNLPAYWLTRRTSQPLFEPRFHLPTRRDVDWRLLLGAAAFGIGWGIGGFCPGPAIASLSHGGIPILVFCAALIVGMAVAGAVTKK